jgi:uncharacterized membrane protein YfcA
MDISTTHIVLMSLASFFAGTVDAIAGGGGLILLPSLLLAFPNAPVATLLGTNKCTSIAGTAVATAKYLRHVKLDMKRLMPSAVVAFIASMAGAAAVSYADPQRIKPAIALLLVGVLLFTILKPNFGLAAKAAGGRPFLKALLIAASVGFYDGFLGPGTGIFFVFGFVGVLGLNFLEGGASAKVLNLATNLAAVGYFAYRGLIDDRLGIPMALCNVVGGYVGSHMAITHGSAFVRKFFSIVVALVLVRLLYDIFWL